MPAHQHDRLEQANKAIAAGLQKIIPDMEYYLSQYGQDQLAKRLSSNRILSCIYWIGVKAARDYGITHAEEEAQEEVVLGMFRGVFGDQWIAILNRMIHILDNDQQAMREGKEAALSGTFYNALLQNSYLEQIDSMFFQSKNERSENETLFAKENASASRSREKRWRLVPTLGTGAVQTFAENRIGDLFAGTDGNGVFCRMRGSNEWRQTKLGNGFNVLNLTTDQSGCVYAVCFEKGIWRSPDGNTWEHLGMQHATGCCMLVLENNKLVLGTSIHGIYEGRIDEGSIRIERTFQEHEWVTCLHEGADNSLYAGTLAGSLLCSSHGNQNWRKFDSAPPITGVVTSLASHVNGDLLIGTGNHGVLRHASSGWSSANEGLQTKGIYCLACSTTGESCTGTYDGGVFFSDNGAFEWNQFNIGLDTPTIHAVWYSQDGLVLAGTKRGMYFLA